MPFEFAELAISGVVLIHPKLFQDERGFFMEIFRRSDFAAAGLPEGFVQVNHSRSSYGTLRGLHFQRAPMAQGKLVRVVAGEIFDVAVDLRHDSPTFEQWVSATLSAENRQMLFIPPGCAHGFCVVSDHAEVVYQTTAEYAPDLEGGIAWDDPALAIRWPVADPILSARDRVWPSLRAAAAGLTKGQA